MIGFVTRNLRHYPRALKENAYMSYVRLLTLLVRSDRHLSVGPSTIRHVKSWRIKLLDWGCLQLFYPSQRCVLHNSSFVRHYTHPGFTTGDVFREERVCER